MHWVEQTFHKPLELLTAFVHPSQAALMALFVAGFDLDQRMCGIMRDILGSRTNCPPRISHQFFTM
jgi:hypothetical protein